VHTFPFPTVYPTNVTICDINGVCATYPTPIGIGQAPPSSGALSQIYNSTAQSTNQSNIDNGSQVQSYLNPNETLATIALIIIIPSVILIYWFRRRKRNKK
jgi:hypothetical protein